MQKISRLLENFKVSSEILGDCLSFMTPEFLKSWLRLCFEVVSLSLVEVKISHRRSQGVILRFSTSESFYGPIHTFLFGFFLSALGEFDPVGASWLLYDLKAVKLVAADQYN